MAESVNPQRIHALVLAGGMGSRSANPALPKILQKIDASMDLLQAHLENFLNSEIKRVTFLLGFAAELVTARLEELQKQFDAIEIDWLIEEEQVGTAAPVVGALENFAESKAFLIVLGDTAIVAPLNSFLSRVENSQAKVAVAIHPNLHPFDSDCVRVSEQGLIRELRPKTQGEVKNSKGLWRPMTGLFYVEREIMSYISPENEDISSALISEGMTVHCAWGFNFSYYLKDSGTPLRLEKIREDFATGAARRKGLRLRSAIFLDRDGTLIPDTGTARKSISSAEIDKDTASEIRKCNEAGIPVFIDTNQPGIAKGELSANDVQQVEAELEAILAEQGAIIDDYIFCPHHPDAGFLGEITKLKVECACRKPRPGMLLELAEIHGLELKSSFVIGDTSKDEFSAAACGAQFMYAKHGDDTASVSNAISQVGKRIIDDYN